MKIDVLSKLQWHVRQNIMISSDSSFIYEQILKNLININHCINYYFFVSNLIDVKLQTKLLLFKQITNESVFHQLCTQKQLDYVMQNDFHYSFIIINYQVMIQSKWKSNYLEFHINVFLFYFAETLNIMFDEEFKNHKHNIINEKLEKLKNFDSEIRQFWSHIDSEYFDFVQHKIDVKIINNLSKLKMMNFFQQYIDSCFSFCVKLSVHTKTQSSENAVITANQKTRVIKKLEKILSSVNIKIDSVKFKKLFENMNITNNDYEMILSAVSNFLQHNMRLLIDQVIIILSQDITKSEYIVNVLKFKTCLAFNADSLSVVNLSEFENLKSKFWITKNESQFIL